MKELRKLDNLYISLKLLEIGNYFLYYAPARYFTSFWSYTQRIHEGVINPGIEDFVS